MSATLFQADEVSLVEVQVGSTIFSVQYPTSKNNSRVRNIQVNPVALILHAEQDEWMHL